VVGSTSLKRVGELPARRSHHAEPVVSRKRAPNRARRPCRSGPHRSVPRLCWSTERLGIPRRHSFGDWPSWKLPCVHSVWHQHVCARSEPERDVDLVRRTGAGDRSAFEHLVERHQASVFRFVRTLVRDRAAYEDILQETFLAALARGEQLSRRIVRPGVALYDRTPCRDAALPQAHGRT
jgi:Sigma-70 region 2